MRVIPVFKRTSHPDEYDRIATAWRHSLQTGDHFYIERRIRRATGIHDWSRTAIVPTRDSQGRITGWYGGTIDLDAYRHTEAELRDRERELSQLVDMVPSHLWRLAPDGEPIFFNKRMVDFLGLDVADMDKPGMSRLEAMIDNRPSGRCGRVQGHAQPLLRHWRELRHAVSPAPRRRRLSLDVEPRGTDAGSGRTHRPVVRPLSRHRRSDACRRGVAAERAAASADDRRCAGLHLELHCLRASRPTSTSDTRTTSASLSRASTLFRSSYARSFILTISLKCIARYRIASKQANLS